MRVTMREQPPEKKLRSDNPHNWEPGLYVSENGLTNGLWFLLVVDANTVISFDAMGGTPRREPATFRVANPNFYKRVPEGTVLEVTV